MFQNSERKPEIEYPCDWDYKIIGNNVDGILYAIEDAAHGLDYKVSPSNVSKTGKYVSINLKVKVENEYVRNSVYSSLDNSESVIMVL